MIFMRRVPELSLADFLTGDAKARARFSDALMAGLQDYGFIILTDHAVSHELLDNAYRLSAELFSLPTEEKLRYAKGLRGYTPFGTEHAKDSKLADLKEFWQIGPTPPEDLHDPQFPPNVWPSRPEQFRQTFEALFRALHDTGRALMRALAPKLDLPADYFDPILEGGPSLLRLLHYPPVPAGISPGAVRAAAHEDINFITILVAARGAGLELLDRDGAWLPVETTPRNLIVDSGDMLARLTNGVVPATTHRVVNPTADNVSRYSMPFFMHPRNDTSLACLDSCRGDGEKYPPITAGEFLAERLAAIGLTR